MTTWVSDKAGRLVSLAGTGTGTIAYAYLANGAKQKVTYPGGVTAEYAYRADGRLKTLSNKKGYTGLRGNYVVIEHDGGYVSVYQHNTGNLVKYGDTVGQGETIATVGNTGAVVSTGGGGHHLHFELLKDPPKNKMGTDGEMEPVQANGEPYFGNRSDTVLPYHLNPNEYLPAPGR